MDALPAPLEWWNTGVRTGETWWTRQQGHEAVAAACLGRTRELIAFAARHSPLYRRLWRGTAPERAALRQLPPVTKRELMAGFDDWLTDRSVTFEGVLDFLRDRSHIGEPLAGRYFVWKSSGSTGDPGVYLQDGEALAVYDALLTLQLRTGPIASRFAWGVLAQGGRAALVAATGDHFASIAAWQRVCRGLPWPTARAFSVADPLPKLVAGLNAFAPAFLAAYPTTLAILGREKKAGRLRIAPWCIWSGGEHLSRETHRAIERAFGTVVVNEYGASECLSIAQSCPHGTLHLNADWVVLEPVDRDYAPTPSGEPSHTVLLTNLANRIQPIIRYDLGDSVTLDGKPCACGSVLPSLDVGGRCDDVLCLRSRDGRAVRLPPLALTTLVEDVIGNHRFQIVQTSPEAIDVRLEASEPAARSADWHAAHDALAAFLAQRGLSNVRVRLAAKGPEPDPRSGKMREVLCLARHAGGLGSAEHEGPAAH